MTNELLEEQLHRANQRIEELTALMGLSKTEERICLEFNDIFHHILAAGEMVCEAVNSEVVAPLANALKRYNDWEAMQ